MRFVLRIIWLIVAAIYLACAVATLAGYTVNPLTVAAACFATVLYALEGAGGR